MNSKAATPVVTVDTTIAASPERVWAAMTNRTSPMFMGATMDTDWRPGSKYTLHGDWQGHGFTDYGVIETATPGKELSFTHWAKTPEPPENYNAVGITLEARGSATLVRLAQFARGKAQSFDDKTKAEFSKNWAMMLDGLKRAAEA